MNYSVAIAFWACSLFMLILALIVSKLRKPIHFFAGTSVEPKEISDIPAYNRANGLMWAAYGACFAVLGVVSLFVGSTAGIAILVILFTPGIFVLYIPYKRIYNKYKHMDNG